MYMGRERGRGGTGQGQGKAGEGQGKGMQGCGREKTVGGLLERWLAAINSDHLI